MKQTPSVKKLIVRKMSLLMVPVGQKDAFAIAIDAMAKPGNIETFCGSATAWVEMALAAVKSAPNNPYGDDDEAIAAEILRKVESRPK